MIPVAVYGRRCMQRARRRAQRARAPGRTCAKPSPSVVIVGVSRLLRGLLGAAPFQSLLGAARRTSRHTAAGKRPPQANGARGQAVEPHVRVARRSGSPLVVGSRRRRPGATCGAGEQPLRDRAELGATSFAATISRCDRRPEGEPDPRRAVIAAYARMERPRALRRAAQAERDADRVPATRLLSWPRARGGVAADLAVRAREVQRARRSRADEAVDAIGALREIRERGSADETPPVRPDRPARARRRSPAALRAGRALVQRAALHVYVLVVGGLADAGGRRSRRRRGPAPPPLGARPGARREARGRRRRQPSSSAWSAR